MSAGLLPGYTATKHGMLYDGVMLPDSLIKDGRTLHGPVENKVIYGGVSISGNDPVLRNCVVHGEPYVEPQDWRAGRTDEELIAAGFVRMPDGLFPGVFVGNWFGPVKREAADAG